MIILIVEAAKLSVDEAKRRPLFRRYRPFKEAD